ncbi:protein PHR1-LIKE 1-like isoform X2 [Panicum miliaceum]|uniref:Protein PHR1-LIKE 1-like isoform X2 n=1 Tax=Panicum miliaceum TaxID=4540 RepID=A0A3L6QDN0_PANMI|nr:protein PHR1-LIKE 1-like isoform X2 [Panicum miliaceum]
MTHGRFPNLLPSIVHSLNAEILYSNPISHSGASEQPFGGNYPGLPSETTHSADQLGGLLDNSGISIVERQPDSGSVRDPNESDERDEWLTWVNGGLEDIIAAGMTSNYPQMAESAHVSSSLNSETHEHRVRQLVSVPTIPGQLCPTVSSPATINVHSPQRTKVRRRWTTEMHDRFIDAINQLGGCENAKPKAILDIMNVDGLTRDQVKSHLQVQMELQKKLHEMVERTRHDLLEIHRSILGNHLMSLHELEEQQNPNTDGRTVHLLPSPPAAAAAALPSVALSRVPGQGSRAAASDEDGQASEAGSLDNNAGA